MAFIKNSETDLYLAPNGKKYVLSRPPTRFVMSEEGTGMPPITYVAQRGPYQHGESLRDFFLQPRTVQMIIRHNYCDRQDYWNGRNELLSVLVPNSAVGVLQAGTLRKVLPNGSMRDLTCVIVEGPKFIARDPTQWDETSYTETIRFIAHNPIYFDPAQKTFTFTNVPTDLIFPITFPIKFGAGAIQQTLNYAGDWPEYPTITVAGPLDDFTISNLTTNKTITLDYQILAGQTVTFALGYGTKTVTLNDGTNLIGYITPTSDLITFQLVPGANLLSVSADMNGPVAPHTQIQMTYYSRYIGI